jgi:hypothetical protein
VLYGMSSVSPALRLHYRIFAGMRVQVLALLKENEIS